MLTGLRLTGNGANDALNMNMRSHVDRKAWQHISKVSKLTVARTSVLSFV